MTNPKTKMLLIAVVVLLVLAGAWFGYSYFKQAKVAAIDSFEECAAAGYPVLQTYPGQCKTPDGRTFVEQI